MYSHRKTFLVAEGQHLLLKAMCAVAFWRSHFPDTHSVRRTHIGEVVGCDDDELAPSLADALCIFLKLIQSYLAGDVIQEDIIFVHKTERTLDL